MLHYSITSLARSKGAEVVSPRASTVQSLAFRQASQVFGIGDLQGPPHRHPADDQHALSENIRSAVIAEGSGQFPQQYAAKQEAKADEQRDTAIAEQQP